jgi:hypothetical protein
MVIELSAVTILSFSAMDFDSYVTVSLAEGAPQGQRTTGGVSAARLRNLASQGVLGAPVFSISRS